MNHNTDKWHFDFPLYSINDKDPIHAWQYVIFEGVSNYSSVQLSVYPNPVVNTLYIKSNENIRQIEVMDLLGSVIAKENGVDNIDMSSYKTGIYLLRIHTEKGTVTKKVVKK